MTIDAVSRSQTRSHYRGRTPTAAEFIDELRRLLSDSEAGKRIDKLLDLVGAGIESKAAQAKEAAAVAERAFKWRTLTSCLVVVGVCVLGAMQIVTGDAVVGMLGAFFGYLWGASKNAPKY